MKYDHEVTFLLVYIINLKLVKILPMEILVRHLLRFLFIIDSLISLRKMDSCRKAARRKLCRGSTNHIFRCMLDYFPKFQEPWSKESQRMI